LNLGSEEEDAYHIRHLIETAVAIINGEERILHGAVELWRLAGILNIRELEPFTHTIRMAESSTIDLPMDEDFRQRCSPSFLRMKDKEIEKLESFYRERVFRACREILERYSEN